MLSTDLSTRSYHGCAVVGLRGEPDLAGAAAVVAEFTAVAARDRVIIVNLASLEFINSSGAAVLARERSTDVTDARAGAPGRPSPPRTAPGGGLRPSSPGRCRGES